MSVAGFVVHIPEEGYDKLLAFIDKEFPHCAGACKARFMPPGDAPATAIAVKLCPSCITEDAK